MPVPTDVKKVGDALVASGKATLAEARKPFLAWVGVNRVALTRTRELPETVQAQARALQERLAGLPGKAKTLPVVIPASAEVVTAQAKQLAGRAQVVQKAAGTVAGGVAGLIAETYTELVGRGEEVVTTARRQPATKEATAAAKTAKRRGKAAATSARKAASAASESAAATADKTTR
jgi:hypothetical protein